MDQLATSLHVNTDMSQAPAQVSNLNEMSLQSPSYIFYTGHGNYQKKTLDPNEIMLESRHHQAPPHPAVADGAIDPNSYIQSQHLINYSVLMQQHRQHIHNVNRMTLQSDNSKNQLDLHPYSNVPDQLNSTY